MTPLRTADAITALGNARFPVVSKTASYTHTATENKSMYEFSGSLGTSVVLTVAPATVGAGSWFGVHNTGTGLFKITASAGSVDGKTTIWVYPGERFLVRSTGSLLQTIGRLKRVQVQSSAMTGVAAVAVETVFSDPELATLDFEVSNAIGTAGTNRNLAAQLKYGGSYIGGTNYNYLLNATATPGASFIKLSSGTDMHVEGAFKLTNPAGNASPRNQTGAAPMLSGFCTYGAPSSSTGPDMTQISVDVVRDMIAALAEAVIPKSVIQERVNDLDWATPSPRYARRTRTCDHVRGDLRRWP
jgi:hypothetical protein